MATKGKEFHALEMKVRIMAETLCEAGTINSGSRRHFASFAGVDYDTLKAAWRSGRLSNELNEKLALAAGFDSTDPCWIDENVDPMQRSSTDGASYPGRDTVAAFRSMLRRRRDLPGAGTFVRITNERPQLLVTNLAAFSVEDSGQGAVLGDPAPLFFSIVVEPGYYPKGVQYGFKRMRLRLVLDARSRARILKRLAEDVKVEINGAVLEVRGSAHFPEWFLHVQTAVLDGEYSSRQDPLCVLAGAEVGEEFRAEMAVRPMDGTLVAIDGAPLPDPQKRRIIELLCAKQLQGSSDSQGWISLGLQRLSIVRADRT
jgi:hypothetical protein